MAFEHMVDEIRRMKTQKNHPPFLAFMWLFNNGVRRGFFEEFQERVPNDCKVMFHMTWQKLIEYEENRKAAVPSLSGTFRSTDGQSSVYVREAGAS